MAIKVFFDGKRPYAEADTIEEVAALLKIGSNGNSAHHKQEAGLFSSPLSKESSVYDFFVQVNENARMLLTALFKHEKGIRGDEFSEEVGIKPEKFGGIFGGASKIAKKNGLKIEHFVVSEFIAKDSDRYRFYKPGKLLLQYGGDLRVTAK